MRFTKSEGEWPIANNEADTERALLPKPKNLYNKSYFEAARSLGKRSILGVCEDFTNEADAERALLPATRICIARAISRLAKYEKPQHTWRM